MIFVSYEKYRRMLIKLFTDKFLSAECNKDDSGNECSNRGTCVDQGEDDHVCRCDAGWKNSGDGICESCVPLAGCVEEHTEEGSGCHSPDGKGGFEQIPNSCICTEGWKGVLCDTPQCLSSGGHPLECENGECKEGGLVSYK